MNLNKWHWARLKEDVDLRQSSTYVPTSSGLDFVSKGTIVKYCIFGGTGSCIDINNIWYVFDRDYESFLEPLAESL